MNRFLISAILILIASQAQATLIHKDWQNAGDQLITVDSDSGLEWLNFSQTATGHDTVRADLGTLYSGFRFATSSELQNLFSEYVSGIPGSGFLFGSNAGISAQLQFVMDALGYDDDTYRFVNTCEYATGCDPLGYGAGLGIHRHILTSDVATSNFAVWFNDDIDYAQVQALVRVPEPGTLGLAFIGVLALVALGARNHRRSTSSVSSINDREVA